MGKRVKTNVLLIYEQFIASVRLCGYEQLRYLEDNGLIRFQHGLDCTVTAAQCQWADIIVFVRSAAWLDVKLAQENKKRGKRIVYVLDDDLLAVPKGYASYGYYGQASVRHRIWWFLKNSDILASPSRHLLEKYKNHAGQTVCMEEPCMKNGVQKKPGQKTENNGRKLKIGFAGSVDRGDEVSKMLKEALIKFQDTHKKEADLEFMGAKPEFAELAGFVCYPYEENYEAYQKKISHLCWDIGLAPMPDTEFHRSKHYNKYIEYGAIGCVGIYSNVVPYTDIIKDRENGILCENTAQGWLDALEWCLHHPAQLAAIRGRMLEDMQKQFSIASVTRYLVKQMPELVYYKAGRSRKCMVRVYRIVGMLVRGIEFAFRYKGRCPQRLAEKIRSRII